MVKLIITGHGKFATGLMSVIEVILGKQENLIGIDFNDQDLETYTHEIETAVKDAVQNKEGVIIFTDLIGGTPFRIVSSISGKYQNVYILSGTNIPMLMEALLKRESLKGDDLIVNIIEIGKKGIESLDVLLKQKGKINV